MAWTIVPDSSRHNSVINLRQLKYVPDCWDVSAACGVPRNRRNQSLAAYNVCCEMHVYVRFGIRICPCFRAYIHCNWKTCYRQPWSLQGRCLSVVNKDATFRAANEAFDGFLANSFVHKCFVKSVLKVFVFQLLTIIRLMERLSKETLKEPRRNYNWNSLLRRFPHPSNTFVEFGGAWNRNFIRLEYFE